jgi:TP901 family phage tail tape measure protein
LSIDAAGVERGIAAAVRSLQGFERTAAGMGRSLAGLGGSLTGLQRGLGGMQASAAAATRSFAAIEGSAARTASAVSAAGVAIASALTAVAIRKSADATVVAAADIEEAVRSIASIRPDINLDDTFRALQDISTRVPQTAQQLADGLFNIFSSIDVSFADGTRLLEEFSRGAIAAQTDAKTFGTAILGVLNAYKLSVADTGRVQDAFFNTVNRGVVNGQELARSLGVVTSSALAAGVAYDEMFAAIVAVTKEGGEAAQNINNLANLLNKIVTKDSVEEINALGIATSDAQGNIRPLFDVMGELGAALERLRRTEGEAAAAKALQAIFPDAQARQGARVLISQLDAARAALNENQTAAGSATRAFETMVASANNQARLLQNTFVAVLTDIGVRALPAAIAGMQSLTRFLAGVRTVLPDLGTALGQAFSRLGDSSADVARLEGVLNRLFGERSGVAAGMTAFLDGLRNLGQGAGSAISGLAASLGIATAPIQGFISGMQELARLLGVTLFPANTDEEIKTTGRSMDALRKSADLATTPVQRFVEAVQGIARRIQANPQVLALASAVGSLATAIGRALGAVRDLALVFLRPFIPEGLAGDVDGLLTELGKLGTGSAADNAKTILELLGKAADAVARGLQSIAGVVDGAADALERIGQRIDQSGAVRNMTTALGGLADEVVPLAKALAELAGIDLTNLFKTPPARDNAALANEALLGGSATRFQEDSAFIQGAAAAIIGVLNGLELAAAAARRELNDLTTFITELDKALTEHQSLQRLAQGWNSLAAALKLTGDNAGDAATKQDELRRLVAEDAALKADRWAAFTGAVGDALGNLARELTLSKGTLAEWSDAFGKLLGAFQAIKSGDVAGAIALLKEAGDAFQRIGSFRAANLAVEVQGVDKAKADVTTIDEKAAALDGKRFTARLDVDASSGQAGVDNWERELNALPPVKRTDLTADSARGLAEVGNWTAALAGIDPETMTLLKADASIARAELDALQVKLNAVQRDVVITARLNAAQALGQVEVLARHLPRSPAKEGPLSVVPDWQYLLANLPDVMGEMVRVVEETGKRIGGSAQIERFTSIAGAISAAAGAVKATIDSTAGIDAFVVPSSAGLDAVAEGMRQILSRLQAMGRGFSEAAGEQVTRVAGAASAAVGALGAAVENIGKARGFRPATLDEMQTALDRMIFFVGRLSEMGAQFSAQTLESVRQLGEAGATAMTALASTVEAGSAARGFRAATIDDLQTALDRMIFFIGRLSEMGVQFSPDTLGAVTRLGEAGQAAMGALGTAVTSIGAARGLEPAGVHQTQIILDRIIFIIGRLSEMGQQFDADRLARVGDLGDAMGSALGGFGTAVEALTSARGFRAPTLDLLDTIMARIRHALTALEGIGGGFSPEQLGRLSGLGDAISSVFGGIGAALEPLSDLRGFVAPSLTDIDAVFSQIEQISHRFRDLAGQFKAEQTAAMQELGTAAQASFGALGAALDVLPRLVDTRIPDVRSALAQLGSFIADVVREIERVATSLEDDAVSRAGAFSEQAQSVVALLGAGIDGLAKIGDLPDVGRESAARFANGVRVVISELTRITRELAGVLDKQAADTAENINRSLGILGAIAGLQSLNELTAPSSRKIRQFVSAVLATVSALIEQTRDLAPEIARRAGAVGDEIGRALGGLGAGIQALTGISEFTPGKGFEAKVAGTMHFLRLTIEAMRGLAGSVGDPRALQSVGDAVGSIARALGGFLGLGDGELDADRIAQLNGLMRSLAGTGGVVVMRRELAVTLSGGFTVRAEGDGAANQAAAAQIGAATAAQLRASIFNDVALAIAGRAA